MKDNFEQDKLKAALEIPAAVPELINTRIDGTLKTLDRKRKSRGLARKSVLIPAACLAILCLGTLTAFGQNLPIVNSLLKFVAPSAAENYDAVKLDMSGKQGNMANGLGKNINKKTTDQGITLTVTDLAYDGASLIVGFDLSKAGGFGSDVTQIQTDLLPTFRNAQDGTSLTPKNLVADSYVTPKGDGSYQGYTSIYFEDPLTDIRAPHTLTLATSNIDLGNKTSGFTEVNGLWKIDTGLTEKDIYIPARVTESKDVHPLKDNGQVSSVKIVRSALNNIISLKGTPNASVADMPMPLQEFFILDDKGNCLNYKNLLENNLQNRTFNTVISLLKIPGDTRKLTIIPYTSAKGSEQQYEADITKLPVTVKMQDQAINITAIERSPGKLTMHYTLSGLVDNREFTAFEFTDKNGRKITSSALPVRISPMDYETGQGTYEFATDQPEDIVKIIIHEQKHDIQNDYAFNVDLP